MNLSGRCCLRISPSLILTTHTKTDDPNHRSPHVTTVEADHKKAGYRDATLDAVGIFNRIRNFEPIVK